MLYHSLSMRSLLIFDGHFCAVPDSQPKLSKYTATANRAYTSGATLALGAANLARFTALTQPLASPGIG